MRVVRSKLHVYYCSNSLPSCEPMSQTKPYTSILLCSTLLSSNANGGVITSWDRAEFFQMSATPAQAEAMAQDPCCHSIEPNYKIWARGTKKKRLRAPPKNEQEGGSMILKGQEPQANDHQTQCRLGIPEFNLKEQSPRNWGLERIASRGARNGKYVWVSEG